MGNLTEREIFDCLSGNCRLAAEHADGLARLPRKGPTYKAYRESLKLVEGACRQAGYFRQDARWFKLGRDMAHAHKVGGDWLRGIKTPSGARVRLAEGHLHPLFVRMAENLRALGVKAEELRTRATGRMGMILPTPLPGPHRDTRPVSMSQPPPRRRASGLIIPAGASVH